MLKTYTDEINNFLNIILNQPRGIKTLIAIFIDFVCCIFSVWISYYLRLGYFVSLSEKGLDTLIYSLILSFPIFILLGLYKSIFRYSGLYSLLKVSRAVFAYGILFSGLISIFGIEGIPRTIGLIQPIIFYIFISFWRMLLKYLISIILNQNLTEKSKVKALVYGSGNAGRQLVRAIQDISEIKIKGFIDDDKNQQGCFIDGKEIYSREKLAKIIKEKEINLILLAIPSIPRKRRHQIIKNLTKYKIAIRTIPGISDLAKGNNSITDLLDLEMDDLLGRLVVEPFQELMSKNIYSKTILVTGCGGSIGGELCRQIIKLEPLNILLIDNSEYGLYKIHNELDNLKSSQIKIIPIIGSIQDKRRMREIISIWQPKTIFHAAAYKHVPIVEQNLVEGIKNNFIGTFELAKLALEFKVENFVLISTDKAVRPTNIMGATKRLAEISLQAINKQITNEFIKNEKTKFSIVRFGNVLDSSGSVIPKFREQIRNGGPITLTHPEINRYFMTITEASQLVIQASAMAKGGDVFVLDMGEPIKIYDLALKMIQLSGLSLKSKSNREGDIEIIITGLRPGEKLYEELLLSEDPIKTDHPKIFRSKEPYIEIDELEKIIIALNQYIEKNDLESILLQLKKVVNSYTPNSKIVDHTFKKI